ncbi:MAG: hypothetical protein GJ676_13440 [Rhodobacteraceae bacterium]|nr:hypothetical protein [Paracoccaceae bacterium]
MLRVDVRVIALITTHVHLQQFGYQSWLFERPGPQDGCAVEDSAFWSHRFGEM